MEHIEALTSLFAGAISGCVIGMGVAFALASIIF